jgi:hypothetical protein
VAQYKVDAMVPVTFGDRLANGTSRVNRAAYAQACARARETAELLYDESKQRGPTAATFNRLAIRIHH